MSHSICDFLFHMYVEFMGRKWRRLTFYPNILFSFCHNHFHHAPHSNFVHLSLMLSSPGSWRSTYVKHLSFFSVCSYIIIYFSFIYWVFKWWMDFRNLCSLHNDRSLKKYFRYLRNFRLFMGPKNLLKFIQNRQAHFPYLS